MALVYKTINLWAFRDNNVHILCFAGENLGKEIRFKLINSDGSVLKLSSADKINFYWHPEGYNQSNYIKGTVNTGESGVVSVPITKEICSVTGRISCVLEVNNSGMTTKFGSIDIEVVEGIGSVDVSKLNPAEYDLIMSMQGDIGLLQKKLNELALNNDPNVEIVEAKGTSPTLKSKLENYDTFATFPNQTYNLIQNHVNFANTSGWNTVNTGTLTAGSSLLKAISESNLGIYANLEKSVKLNANASILMKIRARCVSGGTAKVKPCWRVGSSDVVIDKGYIVAGNANTTDMTWTLNSSFSDLWFIAKDGTAQATIDRVGLLIISGSTVEVANFECYYSQDSGLTDGELTDLQADVNQNRVDIGNLQEDTATNKEHLSVIQNEVTAFNNNDYIETECAGELVKYRYQRDTIIETSSNTSKNFILPANAKKVKIQMKTVYSFNKYTFINASGEVLKYGYSLYSSSDNVKFYVDVPDGAYACVCSNDVNLAPDITLTVLSNIAKDTISNISKISHRTMLSANLWINEDAWSEEYLDNWFNRMNAVGVKNITLVVVPIMGDDGNFKLRQSEFELLDKYIAQYHFDITTIKFSNKLIGSSREVFASFYQDFDDENIRSKYITFAKSTVSNLVDAYPTIQKCYAINEAAYWYRPTDENYSTDKMKMCQTIIRQCSSIIPTGISFAGFGDYLKCSSGVIDTLKSCDGVIGINHYQTLTTDINRTNLVTASEAYDTWKNQIAEIGFERIRNDGFTKICISESGINDFIENMYDPFEDVSGTVANGEVQAVYWEGLFRLIENDCPYVSDISMWRAEYLNTSSKSLLSVFRKWNDRRVDND